MQVKHYVKNLAKFSSSKFPSRKALWDKFRPHYTNKNAKMFHDKRTFEIKKGDLRYKNLLSWQKTAARLQRI